MLVDLTLRKHCRHTAPKYKGLYNITRKVTPLAYEIELPVGSKIHPVVSVQYLTCYEYDNDLFSRRPLPPGPVKDN